MCIQSEKLYKQKVFSLLINQVSKVSVFVASHLSACEAMLAG